MPESRTKMIARLKALRKKHGLGEFAKSGARKKTRRRTSRGKTSRKTTVSSSGTRR